MPYPHNASDRPSGNGKDPNELGALWEKDGPKGKYYTGEINGVRVVMFPVAKRSSDRSPVFRVLKSNAPDQGSAQRTAPARAPRQVEDIPF